MLDVKEHRLGYQMESQAFHRLHKCTRCIGRTDLVGISTDIWGCENCEEHDSMSKALGSRNNWTSQSRRRCVIGGGWEDFGVGSLAGRRPT